MYSIAKQTYKIQIKLSQVLYYCPGVWFSLLVRTKILNIALDKDL